MESLAVEKDFDPFKDGGPSFDPRGKLPLCYRCSREIIHRMETEAPSAEKNPRRIWPWVLATLVVLGVVLAVVWVRAEVRRIYEQRQPDMPSSGGSLR